MGGERTFARDPIERCALAHAPRRRPLRVVSEERCSAAGAAMAPAGAGFAPSGEAQSGLRRTRWAPAAGRRRTPRAGRVSCPALASGPATAPGAGRWRRRQRGARGRGAGLRAQGPRAAGTRARSAPHAGRRGPGRDRSAGPMDGFRRWGTRVREGTARGGRNGVTGHAIRAVCSGGRARPLARRVRVAATRGKRFARVGGSRWERMCSHLLPLGEGRALGAAGPVGARPGSREGGRRRCGCAPGGRERRACEPREVSARWRRARPRPRASCARGRRPRRSPPSSRRAAQV